MHYHVQITVNLQQISLCPQAYIYEIETALTTTLYVKN